MRRSIGAAAVFALSLSACAEWSIFASPEPGSVGLPNSGWLAAGVQLPDRGVGFVRGRPGEDTRYGHRRLVDAIVRAAATVAHHFPGGSLLHVGDLAGPGGGAHERHASHRSGRDADLAFFVTDLGGHSISGKTAVFDRHGVSRSGSELVRFDVARNWELVRTLLLDDDAKVQWVFCSHGVKALLLRHAARFETDPEAIVRASAVLHQPSNGRPHADHFHVRIVCDARDRARGCRDHGPRWPWIRDSLEADDLAPIEDDAALLSYLRQDDDSLAFVAEPEPGASR